MEEVNPFENISEVGLVDESSLMKMLVSELDFIRDGLGIVNMFLGESLMTAMISLQEMQSKDKIK